MIIISKTYKRILQEIWAVWITFWICFIQVQDIEFAQIEVKVIEGLKAGNDCLKQMHEVSLYIDWN